MSLLSPTPAEFKYARVNATADGENTVISAVTGKRIVVLGYALNLNAAGVITVKDGTSTFASFEFTDGGGCSYAGSVDCPAFKLNEGKALVIENAAGVDTLGHITYVLV